MVKRILFFVLMAMIRNSYGQEVETINRYRQEKLAAEFYEKGIYCYDQSRYAEAVDFLNNSARLDPYNHLTYYFLGASYEHIPDLDKSLLNYNLCLALNPDFSEGLFNRAALFERMGHYKKAVQDFKNLLNVPAGETQAIYFRGIGFDEKDAATGFDQLMTMSGRESDINLSLGRCFLKMAQYDSAVFYYTEAIRTDPGNDFNYVNRGIANYEWGRIDSAKNDFMHALKINPDNSLASYNLSLVDTSGSIESFDRINKIIQNNPELPFAFASRAFYHYQAGNYAQAKMDYDTAIMLDERNAEYYLNRGMCYERMDNLIKTLNDYLMASALDPGDPKVWYNLGNVFYKQEKLQDAIEAYSTSIRLDAGMGTVYYNRGLAYYQTGETEKACMDMQQAVSLKVAPAEDFIRKKCRTTGN